MVATLVFVAASFWLGSRVEIGILDTGREVDFNTLGYVVGCFVSSFVLYLFLREDIKARSTHRYSDWGLWRARTAAVWIAFLTWLGGLAHLWFWATDLTRP